MKQQKKNGRLFMVLLAYAIMLKDSMMKNAHKSKETVKQFVKKHPIDKKRAGKMASGFAVPVMALVLALAVTAGFGDEVPQVFAVQYSSVSLANEIGSTRELTTKHLPEITTEPASVTAEGVYVDGEFVGAVRNIGSVQPYLMSMLDTYAKENGYDSALFVKNITTQTGSYGEDELIDFSELMELFRSDEETEKRYTVVPGDTPIGIAKDFEIPLKDLLSWNPGIEHKLIAGDEVIVGISKPYLSILATVTKTYNRKIAYGTDKIETDKMYQGDTKVVSEGVAGKKKVTAAISYLDGEEVGMEVLSEEILAEPVNEVVEVGTNVVTVPSGIQVHPEKNDVGINLSWPVSGGYISSYFGARWGRTHRALDIAKRGGCYGDSIYAAADGTVTFVGYDGTYGRLVKISHGSGLETWYAHCSGFNVSTGDTVKRGQTIAYIGSSGRSTGPHLHFQVMVNGNYVDPLNYLR